MRKWLLTIIILAIAALIYAVIFGPKNSKLMSDDIQNALSANNYDWASVDMHGHVATIKGEAPNLESARGAIEVAQNTECSKCKGKGTWHKVLNGTSVEKAPEVAVQSPYTFNIIKNADGSVVLDGYVTNPDARDALITKARSTFSGTVSDNTIRIVVGEVTSKTICQSLFDDLKEGKKINFASNRDEIRGSESFDLLGVIASAANQCDSFRVRIEGHTDAQGDATYNQDLSERRANRVLATLANQGVDRERMTSIGFGESRPVADNATAEGRRTNRRTTFILTQAQ